LAFFSREALLAWTGQPTTVEHAAALVSILAVGTGVCGILRLPHALQMAYGWTSLGAATNGISVVIGLPLMLWLAAWYGTVGGALVWPIVNVAQLVISVQVMHRRLLSADQRTWFVNDVGVPLLAVVCVVGVARLWFWEQLSRIESLVAVIGVFTAAIAAAAWAAPHVRDSIRSALPALWRRP